MSEQTESEQESEQQKSKQADFRAGFIALIGRPNAGKSTLLNCVLGQKLSITSNKPQTTRNRVVGIYTDEHMQAVLVDTPGMHKANSRINHSMVRIARGAMNEVDATCWLIDAEQAAQRVASHRPVVHAGLRHIGALIQQSETPIIIALNKVDIVKKPVLLPIIARLSEAFDGAPVVPISAQTGDQVPALVQTWRQVLSPGQPMFPADQVADVSERFVVAELIREKVFRMTHREVPYATAVEVERIDESERTDNGGKVVIFARIYVERDSQKGIIIGKGGQMLKRIGTEARQDIQKLLGARVHLDLHVSVKKGWSENPRVLRELGIE